jgi:site-specific DNA-methyltransferase (adenine-specific)
MLEAGLPQASPEAKDEKQRAPQTRDQAAQIFQVSSRKVQDAISLKKKNPDLLEKVKSGEVTLAQATRVIKREEKLEQLSSRAAQVANTQGWKLYTGDCVFGLRSLPDGYAHLLFADSPYNCGINYGLGPKADLLPKAEYLSWCKQWMTEAYRVCHQCGQFWVLISDEWADHFGLMLTEVGFHRRQWLIWYESFGVNQGKGFNRCSRHLFWMVKNPSAFTFNESAVLRPSDRSAKYGDKRAQPGGKTWDSVWGVNPPIPRLVENAKERLPQFPTQLPLALLEPIVLVGSNPGERVIDLFTGSAALGEAAITHHREYLGYECNPTYAVHARNRLEGIDVNK